MVARFQPRTLAVALAVKAARGILGFALVTIVQAVVVVMAEQVAKAVLVVQSLLMADQ